jgi:enamine deaminase RidA (YjgF/YER057c/UK114 family)
MTVNIHTHSIESIGATEIYISAVPLESASPEEHAEEIFSGISNILHSKKAHIFQERVFATQDAMEIISKSRSEAYGKLDDGVAPSLLVAQEGLLGPLAGIQVHAISCENKPQVVSLNEIGCGRILHMPGRAYLSLSSISDQQGKQVTTHAQAMMEKAEAALIKFGADFLSVPRTWMWLKDILSWYDEFNQVRNEFFTKRGLIGDGTRQSMPASTGIGLGPADGGDCAMDLIAVLGPVDCTKYLQAGGKQQSALDYGSAFSRASKTDTPAGQTVYVSGTASIDSDGETTHIGDAEGQINATIENVRAVLADMHCSDEDVVQVIAYCKTTEVERIFNSSFRDTLSWPWITVICDICREDLLFEIEATAMPKKSASEHKQVDT